MDRNTDGFSLGHFVFLTSLFSSTSISYRAYTDNYSLYLSLLSFVYGGVHDTITKQTESISTDKIFEQ